uniref:Uncharacterized protein n=1 Tax=Mola mola TaxID=94237 RepID=A0A3Q3XE35_MOLML
MIAAQAKLVYHLNKYYNEKCQSRKAAISKTIREVCKVVSDVLKEVEVQEPRFISSLSEMDNRFEGLEVISPTEFEVVLYLNQMGVFNFVDDGSLPGSCPSGWNSSPPPGTSRPARSAPDFRRANLNHWPPPLPATWLP